MITLGLLSMLAVSPDPVASLPGISDQETAIHYATPDGIRDVYRGDGDVIFVRNRTNQWYRVALNEGCLARFNGSIHQLGVDAGADRRLDASDRLVIDNERSCLVNSVRKSAAPPQEDSNSPVTLD